MLFAYLFSRYVFIRTNSKPVYLVGVVSLKMLEEMGFHNTHNTLLTYIEILNKFFFQHENDNIHHTS